MKKNRAKIKYLAALVEIFKLVNAGDFGILAAACGAAIMCAVVVAAVVGTFGSRCSRRFTGLLLGFFGGFVGLWWGGMGMMSETRGGEVTICYVSIHPFIHLSVHLSIFLSIYLSVCLSTFRMQIRHFSSLSCAFDTTFHKLSKSRDSIMGLASTLNILTLSIKGP